MIKTLRRKFMLSNLLLVTIIIVAFFSSLIFISCQYEKQQSVDILTLVLKYVPENPETLVIDEEKITHAVHEDALSRLQTVAFVVQTDDDGKIISSVVDENLNVSEDVIKRVVSEVVGDEEDCDTNSVSKFVFRYLRMPNNIGGYKIAVADTSIEHATLKFMVRVYFFTGLFFFAVMFVISDHMAYKAISPVEKSWNNQNRFVADASHELKTPLTVILANMDIMALNPDATIESQKKWIDNTKSEAKRMTDLVNDMLFLARGDAGVEQNFNFMDVNCSNLVEDCVLTFESLAFEKGISFNEDIDPDIYVYADEAKIKQAVIILIDNALKYVNDNGSISVLLKPVGKSNVKCSVINTGPAIPEEKQIHVFERFFRVDESRARDRGGYGLGLAIASHIMEAHKGKITLEFSDERGTCFSMSLPVKASPNKKSK